MPDDFISQLNIGALMLAESMVFWFCHARMRSNARNARRLVSQRLTSIPHRSIGSATIGGIELHKFTAIKDVQMQRGTVKFFRE